MIVTVDAAHRPLPTEVVLSKRVIVEPVTQETVKLGVVSLVMLSVDDEPVSVAVVISGVPGAASAVVSITIALFAPSEFAAPGVARVRLAAKPDAVLLIVPPFNARAVVFA